MEQNLSLSEIVKQTCKEAGITISELSRKINQSPQNLGKKLNKGTLSFDEFKEIMSALGARFNYFVSLPKSNNDYEDFLLDNERIKNKIELLENQIQLMYKNIGYLYDLNRDIRTKMNVIACSLDMAKKHQNDPKKVEEYVQNIREANDQIRVLLNDGSTLGLGRTPSSKKEIVDSNSLKGKRFLVVEDDKLNREIIADLLEDMGIAIETAENGLEAYNKVCEKASDYYDLILTDIVMPIMDGYSSTKLIKAKYENIPIIAISANTYENDVKIAKEIGISYYVTKPIEMKTLIKTIISTLNGK